MIDFWIVFGLAAQACMSARFIVQWLASEKKGKSVIPNLFWYFSLIGGIGILFYSLHIEDPIFILGSIIGLIIYSRNLWLIKRGKKQ